MPVTMDKIIIIAEIYDKMPSVSELWVIMAVVTAPFLIGTAHRKIAWVLLPLAVLISGWLGYESYNEAFVEAGMKEAIQAEMGWWWIVNSLASAMLPAMVAAGVLTWQLWKTKDLPRRAGHDGRRRQE